MQAIPLVDVSSLRPFVDYFEANGGDVFGYSDRAKIPRRMMESLEGRITKVQATRFLELGREMEGVPDIGYRVGESFGPAQMGPLGLALQRSATLGEALDILARHLRDWWGGTRAWVTLDGDHAWLRVKADDQLGIARDVANQNGIFILLHIIRLAAGEAWAPSRIRIPRTRGACHEPFAAIGDAAPDYDDEELAVAFPAGLLAEPLVAGAPAEAEVRLERQPEDRVKALTQVLRDQILHGQVPGIETAAEMAGTSKRTLQRRLAAEGLSYRNLLDRARFGIACDRLLDDPASTLAGVAIEAGYSHAGSLIRSFRRMTGMTPDEYRRRKR